VKEQATFQFDFALDADASVELEGKALRIEGYAAGFDRDREGEAFMPGVFDKGLEKYFKRNPVLCYHHHTDQALGVVEEAKLDGKGLFVKAKLDDPEPGTPLADVYNKVKSGTIKGFSVGGIFRRKMTPQGPRIHEADVAEISVTPVPMEPGSLFALAGKAFGNEPDLGAALAALEAAVDTFEGKAYEGGLIRPERPTIHTPGDIAKAVDRAVGNVEDAEALRSYLIREAEAMDCMVLIPESWRT
jgi:HK97 family phage prohead protease